MPPLVSGVTLRYLIAVGAVVVTTLIRQALDSALGPESALFLFVLPVIISGLYGGFGPGLAATGLSTLTSDFFFMPPTWNIWSGGAHEQMRLTLFFIEGSLISVLAGRWFRAQKERQKALEMAEAAGRAKDAFFANVSHELRTPLNAIVGWTQLLRSGALDSAESARAVEIIERSARAQARLINDMLDVNRIVSGKLCLEIGPADLAAVVRDVLDSLRPAAEAKHLRLEWAACPDGRTAADAARIQQVIWNLVSNSIKFTPEGGRIEVTLEREGAWHRIRVADTGQGISADFLPHVFERYRQQDGSGPRVHGGLGLGLAIVRHLVDLHGGKIEAQSAGVGRGSTFTVRLPIPDTRGDEINSEISAAPAAGAL